MRAATWLAALALGGCALVGPDYRRPEGSLPGAFGERDVGTAPSVPARWWTLYRDERLDGLVAEALERNADVAAAAARVEEAQAALEEAHATLVVPLVNGAGGASRGRSLQFGTSNAFSLGLSTAFEVDLWGRLRRAERSVRDQLLASRYGRDTVALSLAASVARAYFAARSLDAQAGASREILASAEQGLALARRRADAGIASELDVVQAAGLRAQAAAQLKEVARQRAAIVHQLGQFVGRPDLVLPPVDLVSLPVPALPPAGLPSALLERRPDVRQAEAQLAAATERIGVARAAQFPTLSLTASLGTQSAELGELFSTRSRVWSVGAGLLGPILDGGRYAARTRQAEAQAHQAEAAWRRAAQSAFREVADALSNVRLAADTEADLLDRVEQARGALRLSNLRYESGYSAYLEVLDAQRTLNDALLAAIRNRQAYLGYSVDLMSALGGGWLPV